MSETEPAAMASANEDPENNDPVEASDGGISVPDAPAPPAPEEPASVPDAGIQGEKSPWTVEAIDNRGHVLSDVSSALSGDGMLHVAYVDVHEAKLMYAVGRPGQGFLTEPITTAAGTPARRTALSVDDQGLVHIAFWAGNRARYALGGVGAWSLSDITQRSGTATGYVAIAAQSEDDVAVAFHFGHELYTAKRSPGGDFLVGATGLSGGGVSLSRNAGGGLEFAYTKYLVSDMTTAPPGGNFLILHAVEIDGLWRRQAIDGLPEGITAVGAPPLVALALGDDGARYVASYLPTDYGKPLSGEDASIGRYETTISELRHATNRDSNWIVETVDASGNFGGEVSLQVDASAASHVSYHELEKGELRYATNQGGSWSHEIVDRGEDAGYYASLEIDSKTERAIVVYVAAASKELRVAVR